MQLKAFIQIPPATVQASVPVLLSLDPNTVATQSFNMIYMLKKMFTSAVLSSATIGVLLNSICNPSGSGACASEPGPQHSSNTAQDLWKPGPGNNQQHRVLPAAGKWTEEIFNKPFSLANVLLFITKF